MVRDYDISQGQDISNDEANTTAVEQVPKARVGVWASRKGARASLVRGFGVSH